MTRAADKETKEGQITLIDFFELFGIEKEEEKEQEDEDNSDRIRNG
jgi:hypothetical protein